MKESIREDIERLEAVLDDLANLSKQFIEKMPELKKELEAMETDNDFYNFEYDYDNFFRARNSLGECIPW